MSSLEPQTLDEALLDQIAASKKVARHLHLPIQSGDDGVLRRMGRPYDAQSIRELAARITGRLPLVGLGVDVVAGLPGETEDAFRRTLDLVEEIGATYLHAFTFSERPGTAAMEMTGAVPPRLRKERVRRLRALDEGFRLRFQDLHIGRPCHLVVERCSEDGFEGVSGTYVRMRGEGPAGVSPGDWVAVTAGPSIRPGLQSCRG